GAARLRCGASRRSGSRALPRRCTTAISDRRGCGLRGVRRIAGVQWRCRGGGDSVQLQRAAGIRRSDGDVPSYCRRTVCAALERARLYDARDRQAERDGFLAEASRLLSSSLDYEATLASLAQAAVPALGDWCAVD